MGTRAANPALARLALLSQRGLALTLLAFVAYAVAGYPFARVLLGLLLVAYLIVLQFRPSAWLLVLPIALPLVNLAPWSGRFYLEDFDLFILATLATALWQGAYSGAGRPRFAKLPSALIGLFLASHCLALLRGLLPLAALDANAFSNYYSQYNALRVGKSLLWAVLLIPPLLRAFAQNPARARRELGLGVCLGLAGTGCAALWERGAWYDLLYAQGIYGKFSGLTDFSSRYRITGLFSEMHTGGEAIDGYLNMAWPVALGSLAAAGSRWQAAAGAAALAAGLYSVLVTFSRGSFVATTVSLLVFAACLTRHFGGRAPAAHLWPIAPLLAAAGWGCALLFGKGGFYALIAALGILLGATLLGFWPALRRGWRVPLLAGLWAAGLALMLRGLLTSKWVGNGWGESLALCAPLSAALLAGGWLIGRRARAAVGWHGLGVGLVVVSVLFTVGVPGLSGSFVKIRFSTVEDDSTGRFEHWRHAVALMEPGWQTALLGMGLGVFPHAYLWGKEAEKSSIAALGQNGDNLYLQLSNSMDLAIGQRVGLQAWESYTLSFDARSRADKSQLGINLCRRNILASANGGCMGTTQFLAAGPWQHLVWPVNIGALGDDGRLGRLPLTLSINHFYFAPQTENNLPLEFVDIDNVKLLDRFGEDRLANGDFQHGLDRWLLYSDYYHLPLHIKNLWVDVYFEQGALGLAAFCALILQTLACGLRSARRGDWFAVGLLAAMAGGLSVGLVGTLYDVPRVMFWFFLLQFTLLAQDPTQFAPPRRAPFLQTPARRDVHPPLN